jgi:uncharacterized SAM-binding protein YcdF (DUF218 family)
VRPDAVVVLGAQVLGSGRPSASLQRRARLGVEVWRITGARVLVGSGAKGEAPISEAEAVRRVALAAGIPDDCIVVEERSRSTFEHATRVGAIALDRGWRSLVIVTDRYHLPRSLFLFRRAGMNVRGVGVGGPAGGRRGPWMMGALREVPAWAKALALVWSGRRRLPAAGTGRNGDPDSAGRVERHP